MIYLDNAATSYPKPESVLRAVERTMRFLGANPGRSGHRMSLAAARIVLDAREALASLLHVQNPDDIVFGANCTDMLNLALQGACRQGMHVLTSAYAHNSVLRPLHRLATEGRIRLTIAVDPLARMGPDVDLLALPHADNVTGAILPVEQAAVLCRMHKCLRRPRACCLCTRRNGAWTCAPCPGTRRCWARRARGRSTSGPDWTWSP